MRRYLRPTAVNCPLWARGYTRAMMTKRILTICAAVAAGTAAGTSLALAQAYPPPPGAVYSTAPQPYVQGGYPADYRRGPGVPDFDALDDDEAMNSPALPPPGPVVSPDDPRYGRRPVYTDRAMPTGPILSPDDPRYGRPDGPPPVYSDRNGAPTGPVLSPDDPRYGRGDVPPAVIYSDHAPGGAPRDDSAPRPPEAVGGPAGGPGNVTGSLQQQPPVGAAGKPMVLTALPPDEQPEVASAPAGSSVPDQGTGRNDHRRYPEHLSLFRAGWRARGALRRPRRPRRLYLDRRAENLAQGRVAGLAPADRDVRAAAFSAAFHGRRPRQSARRTRDLSRQHGLSHPRHQPALDDRKIRLLGLHRNVERGRLGSVRPRQGRHPRGRDARRPAAGNHNRLGPTGPRTCRCRASARADVGHSPRYAADRSAAAACAGDGALSQ